MEELTNVTSDAISLYFLMRFFQLMSVPLISSVDTVRHDPSLVPLPAVTFCPEQEPELKQPLVTMMDQVGAN